MNGTLSREFFNLSRITKLLGSSHKGVPRNLPDAGGMNCLDGAAAMLYQVDVALILRELAWRNNYFDFKLAPE